MSNGTQIDRSLGVKVESAPVRAKGKPVGEAEHYVFDTVDQAIEVFGQEETLKLINSQHKTNQRNALREQFSEKLTKRQLEQMAWETMTEEDFRSCLGDASKIRALIDSRMEEIKAKHEAEAEQRVANAVGAEGEGEEDDEDED